jgi:hypothetical protein
MNRLSPFVAAICALTALSAKAVDRNYPYAELEGRVVEFDFNRNWRSYYWREDFTMVVRDDNGQQWRIISREPTPWNNLRLGTTFTGMKNDWDRKPRVKVIGVRAIDRIPEEFYDLKLDPKNTVTAFIVRVQLGDKKSWQDYFVNNWFHRWGAETDMKMLEHYATGDPNYTVYGYLKGIAAPFDSAGQKLIRESLPLYSGTIYHGQVVKATNDIGYEVRVLHLMGRNKETLRYEVFHGDPSLLTPLDQRRPK